MVVGGLGNILTGSKSFLWDQYVGMYGITQISLRLQKICELMSYRNLWLVRDYLLFGNIHQHNPLLIFFGTVATAGRV